MTATADQTPENTPEGPDLDALRTEIDDLQHTPTEELVSPAPASLARDEPDAQATEAIGSVEWDDPEKAPETQD